ncbi:PREDICTED: ATP-dependent DNA helicase Q-like 5 [Tarenaya hassleriana]|uniref:ATP-dependent DNA helicase Q-like 5 n=1 Tax=Tarenaya hassleriana TaxID=28532 RepID=UPI00053C62A6|nr:PREDICTED: ATP-dependent DNA helicase Q-like 5 [Tarenaya hassleriana]
MDSDSDSDGSHVSATPPRDPQPPTAPVPAASRRITSSSSRSKPKSPPPSLPSPFSSDLPFQIRRPSDQHRPISAGTLPAGFFSTVPSFSRLRKASVSFEVEKPNSEFRTDDTKRSLGPCEVIFDPLKPVKRKPPNLIADSTASSSAPAKAPEFCRADKGNFVRSNIIGKRKPPNLITDTAASPPVKAPEFRCSDEGNFVKLNLNGRKRKKFSSKCKSASKFRSKYTYRKTRYRKSEANGEDGPSVEEVALESRKQMEEEASGFIDSAEEAVLAVRNEASDENLKRLLNVVYGYDSFRYGQLEAIKMVLSGSSAMLVLPTGAGKSLCYQIPAMILQGITLVVSPLVSLMIDQLKHLPPVVKGGLLSSSQRPEETAETLRRLKEGTIKVLFVSPERFLNAEFLSMFRMSLSVALVVVDEAHCISEWSHNFRPSYMRLKASLLHSELNAQCILAMTATATTKTLQAMMSMLEIPSTNLIQKLQVRENLQLSVSLSGANRMKELLLMTKSPPFSEVKSIIVYCKFQHECDTISKYLRDNNITAKSYHSGLLAKERNRIQELFCSNKIRVVVATVAFGMGLDKRDVGAVIHYSVPGSLEEYVQEIGRAGRDGRLSYCHLIYDDDTYLKLRSLAHSDGVDEYAVGKFLTHLLSHQTKQNEKLWSLVVESASHKFDMKEEVMLTILTHLELGEVQYLRLFPPLNKCCSLNFHKSSPIMLAERSSVISAILKKSQVKQGLYVFDIPAVASTLGVTTSDVLTELQSLKLKGEITYEMKEPAFCYTIIKFPQDICSLSTHLTKWLSEIETCKVRKLDIMSSTALEAINVSDSDRTQLCSGQTLTLQRRISDYFEGDENCHPSSKITQNSPFLRADIKVFLQSNTNAKFTPRAIARIMHGIGSPAYPSTIWSKTHFWGRYMNVDFRVIMEAAKTELLNFVDRNAAFATC